MGHVQADCDGMKEGGLPAADALYGAYRRGRGGEWLVLGGWPDGSREEWTEQAGGQALRTAEDMAAETGRPVLVYRLYHTEYPVSYPQG
jgi:hypothetical protein